MRHLLASLALVCVATSARADVAKGIYRGTSQTTVKFLDPVTLQVEATRKYPRKLTVVISKPLSYSGVTETSPFHFEVAPTVAGATLVPGDLLTASARTALVQGSPRLLQYWLMENNQSGFRGTFINSHALEGVQRDRLVAPLSDPEGSLKSYRLYDGSFGPTFQVTANGLVTGGDMNLSIRGYAHVGNQAIISFETSILAKKR